MILIHNEYRAQSVRYLVQENLVGKQKRSTRGQEQILCDESNEDTLMLFPNTSVEDIEEWLEKLGI